MARQINEPKTKSEKKDLSNLVHIQNGTLAPDTRKGKALLNKYLKRKKTLV